MPTLRSLLTIVLLITPAVAAAQARPRIMAAEIEGDRRFQRSDLLAGRAPVTHGGRLITEYIASRLRAEGVEPGVSGSGFQGVPTRNRDAESRAVRPAPKP
jgi:hypothetical protein